MTVGTGRKQLTVPLKGRDERDIAQLADLLRTSKAAAVRIAVRRLLRSELKAETEINDLRTEDDR